MVGFILFLLASRSKGNNSLPVRLPLCWSVKWEVTLCFLPGTLESQLRALSKITTVLCNWQRDSQWCLFSTTKFRDAASFFPELTNLLLLDTTQTQNYAFWMHLIFLVFCDPVRSCALEPPLWMTRNKLFPCGDLNTDEIYFYFVMLVGTLFGPYLKVWRPYSCLYAHGSSWWGLGRFYVVPGIAPGLAVFNASAFFYFLLLYPQIWHFSDVPNIFTMNSILVLLPLS